MCIRSNHSRKMGLIGGSLYCIPPFSQADARQLGLIASQALQASTGENLFSSVLKNSPERVWPLHAQSTNVIADGGQENLKSPFHPT